MQSVSNAKYGAQSLSQLMQVLQGLSQRQQRNQEAYAPQQVAAAAPQTPFQGLLSGIIGEHNRRRADAQAQDDAAIQQSLALLDAIPDSPENTPKKLQLLTSILHPKTQKGWKEVWNPQADHTAQAQFLQQFTGMLPSDSGLSANEQQVRDQQITSGPGALLTQGVNQKYAEQNRGKFEFPDEDPYYAPQIIQTPDGKLKAIQYPKRGGTPLIHDIGEGQTEKQTVAGIRWQGKGSTTDPDAVARRAVEAEAIKLAEADEHAWKSLSEDQKEIYRFKAGKSLVAKDALTAEAKKTGIAEALANAGRGGVTGGQAATIQRQDTQDQLRAKEDVTKFEAELGKFQTEMNGIWNSWKNSPYAKKKVNGQLVAVPDGELENHMKLFDPDGYARYNKLKAEITSAKTSLQGAQERAKVVGKATPRGGGSGGRSLTGNLDIDRIMRNAPPSTGAQGGEHYVVQDPTPQQLQIPKGFDLNRESTPENPTGLRSLARVFNNPNVFIMNPSKVGVSPRSLVKGARLEQRVDDQKTIVFEVMAVSADKTKALVHKIPE